ncbi:hypothetical protein DB346_19235 [Verrucomicrobia bacterium LW23]|nr:hypothetical protein DB346_19235 [Verrucomicrobia bacterium LW23]
MTTILRTTLRGLGLLGVLLLAAPVAYAQPAGPKPIELEVSQSEILPGKLDNPTAVPSILEAVEAPKQVTATGASVDQTEVKAKEVGKATLTLTLNGVPVEYAITVVPAAQRIYINLNESTRLTFNDDIDEVSFSNTRFVRQRQPNNRTLLLEAIAEGKAAVTVITKNGTIYQYAVSTFDNRGADVLRIRNEFTMKGYKGLSIEFTRDQATLAGFVATQEELDDATRIVKKYTPYVDVKVTLGTPEAGGNEYSEDEAAIINSIHSLARIKGLVVRVKFPRPTITETSRTTVSTGDVINAESTTRADNVTTTTGPSFAVPADGNIQDYRPRQNETITRSVNRVRTTPEKIFLYGELEDDLEEARALRVARTYSPLVVSFMTVKDPIQLRLKIRFVQINKGKLKDTGILWTDSAGGDQPSIGAGVQFNSQQAYVRDRGDSVNTPYSPFPAFDNAASQVVNKASSAFESLLYNLQIDAVAQLRLIDQNNYGRVIQEANVNLTNGQVGYFFAGSQVPYVSGQAIATSGATISEVSFLSVGVGIYIIPLNYERGSQENGTTLSILTQDDQERVPTLGKVMGANMIRPLIQGSEVPILDESMKFVDENGLIGLNVEANVSTLDSFLSVAPGISAPQTTTSLVGTRSHLRDGQSVVLGGILSDTFTKNVRGIPWLRNVPLFSWLFENPRAQRTQSETVAVFTPEIIRMRDMDTKRNPRPEMPETEDVLRERGDVPVLKAIPYKPTTVEMRPVSDVKAINQTPVTVKDRPAPSSDLPETGNGRAIASRSASKPAPATTTPVAAAPKKKQQTVEAPARPKPLPPVEDNAAPQMEDRPAGSPTINTEYGPAASAPKARPSSTQASLSANAPETIP